MTSPSKDWPVRPSRSRALPAGREPGAPEQLVGRGVHVGLALAAEQRRQRRLAGRLQRLGRRRARRLLQLLQRPWPTAFASPTSSRSACARWNASSCRRWASSRSRQLLRRLGQEGAHLLEQLPGLGRGARRAQQPMPASSSVACSPSGTTFLRSATIRVIAGGASCGAGLPEPEALRRPAEAGQPQQHADLGLVRAPEDRRLGLEAEDPRGPARGGSRGSGPRSSGSARRAG